jgi:hypothetical protein
MSENASELGERIDELTTQITQLTSDPAADPDAVDDLLRELEKVEAARRSAFGGMVLSSKARDAAEATSRARRVRVPKNAAIPVRERVLTGLELLGVPARGSLVTVAAAARTGLAVEPRQLASLRRSELASWRAAPDRRPAYVVPALHSRRFEPLRGFVASSAWEPWRRIVGPLSPRADHLRATIHVAENVEWARGHSPDVAARFERLLWRLARSVPSALDAADFEVEKVATAAEAELALLEEEDRAERDAAAKRLSKLAPEQQLFGAGLQVVREEDA